jgi:environmental stress-induced protein Ves
MSLRVVRAADQPVLPWRNGGGVTSEIAVGPGTPFAWRASRALVASDGPFSDFSGYGRVLVLLAGRGMELRLGERGVVLAQPLDMVRFDGAASCDAHLLGGETEDFNWMVLRSAGEPTVEVVRGPRSVEGICFYALSAALLVVEGRAYRLEPSDALVAEGGERADWREGTGLAAGIAQRQ